MNFKRNPYTSASGKLVEVFYIDNWYIEVVDGQIGYSRQLGDYLQSPCPFSIEKLRELPVRPYQNSGA